MTSVDLCSASDMQHTADSRTLEIRSLQESMCVHMQVLNTRGANVRAFMVYIVTKLNTHTPVFTDAQADGGLSLDSLKESI